MLPRGLASDAKRGGVSWAEILIAFVVLAILAALFPFTGDDWAWGSSIGIERLQSGFADRTYADFRESARFGLDIGIYQLCGTCLGRCGVCQLFQRSFFREL